MPLLKINADRGQPFLHGPGDLDTALRAAVRALPADAPVIILIHGYRFSPTRKACDPHRHILSLTPTPGCRKAISWPRHLGFGRDTADEGLCIAFGWEARGSIWRAWEAAAQAGTALADLVRRLRALRRAPVDILCHSLGARVGLCAVSWLAAGSVGRVVLMAAADYRSHVRGVLDTPAGRTAEFVNVTSRENDPFDAAMEWLIRAPAAGDRALGDGLGQGFANWLDLQVDCPETLEVLRDLGYRIAPPSRRVCHWSAYLRPGLFRVYGDLIRDRDLLPLDRLAGLLPGSAAPRWSGLWRPERAAPRSLLDRLAASRERSCQARRSPSGVSLLPALRYRIWRTGATGP